MLSSLLVPFLFFLFSLLPTFQPQKSDFTDLRVQGFYALILIWFDISVIFSLNLKPYILLKAVYFTVLNEIVCLPSLKTETRNSPESQTPICCTHCNCNHHPFQALKNPFRDAHHTAPWGFTLAMTAISLSIQYIDTRVDYRRISRKSRAFSQLNIAVQSNLAPACSAPVHKE